MAPGEIEDERCTPPGTGVSGLPERPERPLSGRRAELALLQQALDGLSGGVPRVVEVFGDPGIGKTRLLVELAERARRAGVPVAWGRAAELDAGIPFAVFSSALDRHLAGLDQAWLNRLRPQWLGLLGEIFPSLPHSGEPARPSVPDTEQYHVHRAVAGLLELLAKPSGLVLILDDLHSVDDASAELLDHLLRNPPSAPVLLVLAARPRQTSHRLCHALSRAVAGGLAQAFDVGPLSPAEADELLPPGLGAAIRRELYRQSGGNPFYLEAFARSDEQDIAGRLVEDTMSTAHIPAPMRSALAAELAVLSPQRLLVAQAAAVAGETFQANLVMDISEVPWAEVLAAVDELTDRDLVRPDGGSGALRYRNSLIRGVTYDSAGAGWRLAAHRRAAAALERAGAAAVERAPHVERSAIRGDTQAVAVLVEAATATMSTGPATAERWLRAALTLLPDTQSCVDTRLMIQGMRARALGVAGRLPESRDALHEVLHLIPAEDVHLRAQTVGFCAMVERLLGQHHEARARLLAELAALPEKDSPAAVVLQMALAGGYLMQGGCESDRDWISQALATARRIADPLLIAAASSMYVVISYWAAAVEEPLVELLSSAGALIDALTDRELGRHLDAIVWLCRAEIYLEQLSAADRHVDRGIRIARAGQNHLVPSMLITQGTIRAMLGDLPQAADRFEEALEAALLTGSDEMCSIALANQCWVTTWRGDTERARRLGERAVAAAGKEPNWAHAMAGGMLALASLYDGDPDRCVDLLLSAGGGPDLPALDNVSRPSWYQLLAAADAARDRFDDAARWADRGQAVVAELGLPLRIGYAELAQAHAVLRVDPEKAVVWGRAAAKSFEKVDLRMETGRARLLTGMALGAADEPDQARQEFAQARALFDSCSARLFYDQTVREERRMNARQPRRARGLAPKPQAGGGFAERWGLTARELAMIDLVVLGRTNRQIAEELFVSVKTVEMHLSRVYAKVGVSSRAAVAGLFSEGGQGPAGHPI